MNKYVLPWQWLLESKVEILDNKKTISIYFVFSKKVLASGNIIPDKVVCPKKHL